MNRQHATPGMRRSPFLFSVLSVLSVFSVLSCSDAARNPNQPSTGSLEITTTTTGEPATGDGYFYVLDGNPAEPIAFNTTIHLTDLFVRSHTIQLTTLPEGCTVSSQNPVTVGVTSGGLATAAFEVSCVPPGIGNIQVTAATSGPGASDNYALLLDGQDQGIIGFNGTLVLPDVAAGGHAVGMSDIPGNCQLQESDPQPVTVLADEMANVSFTVICSTPPAQTGLLNITASTSGTDPDGYLVSVDGGAVQPISINGALTITKVATGGHSILLEDLDGSCTVTGLNPVNVTISAGLAATPAFEVSCGVLQTERAEVAQEAER
jgi:hypothetical protein